MLIGMIQRQGSHLSRILDDLLDVARVTQGRIELRREIVSVAACIELALEALQPLLKTSGHRLAFTRMPQAAYVNADKVRIEQCITNVLTNAVKYTNPGGDIRVKLSIHDEHAVIEVADTGVGIAPEFLPHMFDLFAQSERALDRSEGGLGIGLCVCKQLIEMHGGTICGESKGIGQGATLTIRLPLRVTQVDVGKQATSETPFACRVLIVDDNCDAADSLAMCLVLEGHDAKAVYSAELALQQVESFCPDVVLLDIGLPIMDGYEVARRIKASHSAVHVVALTGYGQEEDKQRTASAGFAAHLIKPLEMQSLQNVLTRLA
jgi:CheY-like chemotaxis protein